ncbi:MAG: hypothetical protein CVV25_11930 [Ignavibacteriae bacterium HGW-Ignavibacteriae-4]|jgi:hypothetical protein|nr:MAG: hypothetical protein CVV25_11930 [Ignavibacteriae bacterium HGW-Ignavibacteriae-4]
MKFISYINTKLVIPVLLLLIISIQELSTGTIKGKVFDVNTESPVVGASIRTKYSTKSVYTDSSGNFEIQNIDSGLNYLNISFNWYDDSTLKDIHVSDDKITDLIINYDSYCQYSKADSLCPVCKKIDKVIPIEYGYLVITKEEYEKRNDKNQKEDLRTFKSGGCEISGCDPFWYCKRDSISF